MLTFVLALTRSALRSIVHRNLHCGAPHSRLFFSVKYG